MDSEYSFDFFSSLDWNTVDWRRILETKRRPFNAFSRTHKTTLLCFVQRAHHLHLRQSISISRPLYITIYVYVRDMRLDVEMLGHGNGSFFALVPPVRVIPQSTSTKVSVLYMKSDACACRWADSRHPHWSLWYVRRTLWPLGQRWRVQLKIYNNFRGADVPKWAIV